MSGPTAPRLPWGIEGWTPGFAERLQEVITRLGGQKAAARIAGVTAQQVGAWRDGKARPQFFGIAGMARAAGVSLDWLVTGEGSKTHGGAA